MARQNRARAPPNIDATRQGSSLIPHPKPSMRPPAKISMFSGCTSIGSRIAAPFVVKIPACCGRNDPVPYRDWPALPPFAVFRRQRCQRTQLPLPPAAIAGRALPCSIPSHKPANNIQQQTGFQVQGSTIKSPKILAMAFTTAAHGAIHKRGRPSRLSNWRR